MYRCIEILGDKITKIISDKNKRPTKNPLSL